MNAPAHARLLIVDDEAAQLRALCDILQQEGYVTRGVAGAREALAALREEPFDALLTDLSMPQVDGITLLRACREIDRDLACIVMTGHATVSTAVEALKSGAIDYLTKPFNVKQILAVLSRALELRWLQLENIQLRESVSIYELARAITQGLSEAEVVERTLASAAALSDCRAVYMLRPSGAAEPVLRLAGQAGPDVQPVTDLAPPAAVLADWLQYASRELEALTAESSASALVAHPFDRALGIALPIQTAGQLFGILGFSSSQSRRRMRIGQLKTLDVLARTAATAFARAALVTELRDINQALEQRVEERTRELEMANRDLESFAYSISHDLRQPLSVIEGFCELFRAEFGAGVPPGGQPLLEQIWSGTRRMSKLIDDLLHFSRMGRAPLERLRVPLRAMVLEVSARLMQPRREPPAAVQVGDLPDCWGDPALIEQVLVNLLANAIKFSAGRSPARIEVGVLRRGDEAVYYVRDNGVGFDMRYAEKLFGVFQRLHTADEFEGTGIGLSIVHRIVTRHGGKVWADSRKGEGATFYFTLAGPAVRAEAGAALEKCEVGSPDSPVRERDAATRWNVS